MKTFAISAWSNVAGPRAGRLDRGGTFSPAVEAAVAPRGRSEPSPPFSSYGHHHPHPGEHRRGGADAGEQADQLQTKAAIRGQPLLQCAGQSNHDGNDDDCLDLR